MESASTWVDPEPYMREMLGSTRGVRFLEIGIGLRANVERLRALADAGGTYTACDFQHVCDAHEAVVRAAPELRQLTSRFLGNPSGGTYAWTLFELVNAREQFDVIYLDGHHTFYVDLPAVALAHLLLKPGGVFVLDDIPWTLEFHKRTVQTSFPEWKFFRNVYDFSQYTPEQQEMPHMKMMAETFLMGGFNYSKIEERSTAEWWALRKPCERTREPGA